MNKAARKTALGVIAVTVMALTGSVTVAYADQGDTLKGGCGFATDQDGTVDTGMNGAATSGQNQGVIYDLSVSQEALGTPSDATVACWIDVNGVPQNGTRIDAAGNGVQADSAQISFAATDTDIVSLCQQVTFDDGSEWVGPDGTDPDCPAVTTIQIPPQVVVDTLNALYDTLSPVIDQVERDVNDKINSLLNQLPGDEQMVMDAVNGVLGQLPGIEQEVNDTVNMVLGELPGVEQTVTDQIGAALAELSGFVDLVEQEVAPVLAELNGFLAGGDICTPVTADGKPLLCANREPVDGVIAQVQQALAAAEAMLTGAAGSASAAATECRRIETHPNGADVYLAYAATHSGGITTCTGYKVSVTGQTAGQPVHVPQLCVTTTGTCVGPFDTTVPGPDILQSPVQVCDQAMTWSAPTGTSWWTDQATPGATGNLGCTSVP